MSWAETLTPAERKQLVAWARSAVHGVDQSAVFVGVLDGSPLDVGRIEFTLQLGHALLNKKPIVLTVPHGVDLPPKLVAVADCVVRYDPSRLESISEALTQALSEMGINRH